ncbi:MAG: polysaccharide deacetylase family protein, partial [Leptospira sp.]|nr:polysaccharide deacetylase family protein [Leptospira sp.]
MSRNKEIICNLKKIFISVIFLFFSCQIRGERVHPVPEKNPSDVYPRGFYPNDPVPDKIAYLTFDDGPSDWTDELLDTLKKESIKATFFICGRWLPAKRTHENDFFKYRSTILRMIRDGHSVGNHTLEHKNLGKVSAKEVARQLDENQELLNQEIGKNAPLLTLMRPPYGLPWYGKNSRDIVAKAGSVIRTRSLVILWSAHFDSGDSAGWAQGEWYENGPRIHVGDFHFKKKMQRVYNEVIENANGKG